MKTFLLNFSCAFLLMLAVSDAQAVVCANGVWRAGCAGPNGAVVARKPVVTSARRVVVVPGRRRCVWINGRRVCRF